MIQEQIAENALKQKLGQEAAELNDALVKMVAQAQRGLNDGGALAQTFQMEGAKMAEAVENAQQFVRENGMLAAELDPTGTLKANIGEAKRVGQMLEKRQKDWEQFQRQRDAANAHMDSARKALEGMNKMRELAEAEALHEKLMVSLEGGWEGDGI